MIEVNIARVGPSIDVPLESILCTDELNRRPSRLPDYLTENRALVSLAQALADSPRTILHTLTDIMLETLHCGSAGISLLSTDGTQFHWPAIAGLWKPHIGRGSARDFGPCGDVLDRNVPLLFRHLERRYVSFQSITPPIEEYLSVPLYVAGKAVGTIWAITHDKRRSFDNEDLRMLVSLGGFASLACRAAESWNELDHEGEERYRTLFDLAPIAVYSCDASGVIRDYNNRAAELWGRKPAPGDTDERFCGSFRLYRPDGTFMPHEQCPMGDVLSGRVPGTHDAEVVIERPDASRVIVIVNIAPLTNDRGEITGAINCFYDVTARKALEREYETLLTKEHSSRMEAEAANRSKDVFLAMLSHEVRTPLSAMMGWATILRKKQCTQAEMQEGIKVIERNCRAQAQLMDDALEVSRIISGKLRLDINRATLHPSSMPPSTSCVWRRMPRASSLALTSTQTSSPFHVTICACNKSSGTCSPMRSSSRRKADTYESCSTAKIPMHASWSPTMGKVSTESCFLTSSTVSARPTAAPDDTSVAWG